jgi:hypothetical protein
MICHPDGGGAAANKPLRGLAHPLYRLRVDDLHVFYDVIDDEVRVLAIITESDADAWLAAELHAADLAADRLGQLRHVLDLAGNRYAIVRCSVPAPDKIGDGGPALPC